MDKKMFRLCLCVLISIFVIPAILFAASFDCSKAKTKTEKAVCGDPAISQLDDDLAAAYGNALKTDDRDEIKKSQRRWLKETLSPCMNDKACIKKAYENRLLELMIPLNLQKEQLRLILNRQSACNVGHGKLAVVRTVSKVKY